MSAFRIVLAIAFRPPLTIAKEQAVLDAFEALAPEHVDFNEAECVLRLVRDAATRELASHNAENEVARSLFAAGGFTLATAPLAVQSVSEVRD